MQLTSNERADLAAFLARRITVELTKRDPAEPPAPGDPVAAWVAALEEAEDAGRLGELAARIRSVDPSDPRLQQACSLLIEGSPRPRRFPGGALAAGGAACVALVALAVAGLMASADAPAAQGAPTAGDLVAPAVDASPQAAATEAPDAATLGSAEAPEAPTAMSPVEPAPKEEVASAPKAVAPAAKEAPARAPATSASPQAGRSAGTASAHPCNVGDGLIGYWYAGEESPGAKGDTLVLDRGANVRAEYPGPDNRFRRAPVRCVIEAGTTVVLSGDPVHVPRDDWWVPLTAGDVTAVPSRR